MSETPDSAFENEKAEVARLLQEVRQLRASAEEAFEVAAQKRKEVDEHATYAFQAKVNTEKHAKEASALKGQMEGDASTLATTKKNFDEILAAAMVAKAGLDADTKAASEKKRAFDASLENTEVALSTARDKTEAITKAKLEADALMSALQKLRDEAAGAQAKSDRARAKAEEAQAKAAELATQASELVKQLTSARDKGGEEAGQIKAGLEAVNADRAKLAEVISHLDQSDKIAVGHENRVAELAAKLAELNDKAEKLLPGATSAGLASSFLKQKERFAGPQRRWLWTFMICIGLLIVVAAPSYWAAIRGDTSDVTWDSILLGMALRLPIVIPLVWLAIYAGRNYMLSVRLEEDYAFKEAISMAFEGYKREMDKIGAGDVGNPSPLTKLCLNVLSALAERPGRIYEGHQKDITVATAAVDALRANGQELKNRVVAPVT
ncbi:MAG: hypothetical protein NDI75_07855 [Candidatus Didemnitutus sp.]|nr:hypothetical protein [Candidatus Didemnitutus sp.]